MDKLILGVHDGHNCGATLTRDGKVVASVSEERLTRKKNEIGFPEKSIIEVLRIGGVDPKDLDEIAYASLFMHSKSHLEDMEARYIVGLSDQRRNESKPKEYEKVIFDKRRRERINKVLSLLGKGVSSKIVHFVEHHVAHAAAAYYTAPTHKSVLAITCDGAGDELSATVSICRDNRIRRIAATGRHASLGKLYSRVTMLMGMKPWEHEYKVMGLAPYCDNTKEAFKAFSVFQSIVKPRFDSVGFEKTGELSTHYCYEYLRKNLERIRFDAIASGIQMFTEAMLKILVRKAISCTGIRDVVLGGGVFMNVKANMQIAEMPEVRSLYVMPSSGDESLSIGACLYRYYLESDDFEHQQSVFGNLYLGGDFSRKEEEYAIIEFDTSNIRFSTPDNMDLHVAGLIKADEVVARCSGPAEWGARALGNRSILARADNIENVEKINKMIKMRDFWMPFVPTIAEECSDRYFDNRKRINPYFMTSAFKTKSSFYKDIKASSHPADKTIRPQIVTKYSNPRYHKIVSGVGGVVLNTSFNLHGHPIVYSPKDAIKVFLESGLTHLALKNHILSKKEQK